MRKIPVSTGRDHFTDVVNQVAYGQEAVAFTRRGKQLAVLLSTRDYDALRLAARAHSVAGNG